MPLTTAAFDPINWLSADYVTLGVSFVVLIQLIVIPLGLPLSSLPAYAM
jgi:hypothetical protein